MRPEADTGKGGSLRDFRLPHILPGVRHSHFYMFTEDEKRLVKYQKKATLSKGEDVVATFLMRNRISFIRNYYFTNFVVRKCPKLLFFDFYIPEYNCCIEYDGEQHYTRKFNGHFQVNGEKNDFLKSAFCKKMGIPLLRIKYTDQESADTIICKFFDKYFPIK